MKKALTLSWHWSWCSAVGLRLRSQGAGQPNGYNSIKFAMAVNGTDTQIDTRVANKFKELVEEASGGVITVDVFPNDQLAGGNASKGIEMISDGSVDMAAYATSVLSALDERVSIGTVPWLFDSYAEAREVIDSTGLAYYDSVLERLDLKVIGSFHNGLPPADQQQAPRDLARGPQGPEHPRARQRDIHELLQGLRRRAELHQLERGLHEPAAGVIDGQENGVSITATSGMTEVQDYMTIWNYT